MRRFGTFCLLAGFVLLVVRFVIAGVNFVHFAHDSTTPRPVDPLFGLGMEQYCGILAIVLMLFGVWMILKQK